MIPLSSSDHEPRRPVIGENPYNRSQGLAIAQFSVAIGLISGLSVAGLLKSPLVPVPPMGDL